MAELRKAMEAGAAVDIHTALDEFHAAAGKTEELHFQALQRKMRTTTEKIRTLELENDALKKDCSQLALSEQQHKNECDQLHASVRNAIAVQQLSAQKIAALENELSTIRSFAAEAEQTADNLRVSQQESEGSSALEREELRLNHEALKRNYQSALQRTVECAKSCEHLSQKYTLLAQQYDQLQQEAVASLASCQDDIRILAPANRALANERDDFALRLKQLELLRDEQDQQEALRQECDAGMPIENVVVTETEEYLALLQKHEALVRDHEVLKQVVQTTQPAPCEAFAQLQQLREVHEKMVEDNAVQQGIQRSGFNVLKQKYETLTEEHEQLKQDFATQQISGPDEEIKSTRQQLVEEIATLRMRSLPQESIALADYVALQKRHNAVMQECDELRTKYEVLAKHASASGVRLPDGVQSRAKGASGASPLGPIRDCEASRRKDDLLKQSAPGTVSLAEHNALKQRFETLKQEKQLNQSLANASAEQQQRSQNILKLENAKLRKEYASLNQALVALQASQQSPQSEGSKRRSLNRYCIKTKNSGALPPGMLRTGVLPSSTGNSPLKERSATQSTLSTQSTTTGSGVSGAPPMALQSRSVVRSLTPEPTLLRHRADMKMSSKNRYASPLKGTSVERKTVSSPSPQGAASSPASPFAYCSPMSAPGRLDTEYGRLAQLRDRLSVTPERSRPNGYRSRSVSPDPSQRRSISPTKQASSCRSRQSGSAQTSPAVCSSSADRVASPMRGGC